MRKILLLFGFTIIGILGIEICAQAPFDDNETAKLRKFLLQESAEPGVKNYQQLGIADINNVNWATVPGLSWNSQTYLIERLYWQNRKLSGNADFSDFSALRFLYLANNEIKSVNVRNASSLIQLDLYENDLDYIDVETNISLELLRLGYNNLTSIDVSNNVALKELCCTYNQIESLNVTDKANFRSLLCLNNGLKSLVIENCPRLDELVCGHNDLTSLDLSNLYSLRTFSCVFNDITDLNFYNCTSLSEVLCDRNQLQSLDFSYCENLATLSCEYNELTELKIKECKKLKVLKCKRNSLDNLDFADGIKLSTLWCEYNYLDFLTLLDPSAVLDSYIFNPQAYIDLDCKYDSIDLQHIYEVYDNTSIFTWQYKLLPIRPQHEDAGVFSFDESYIGETFLCRVENSTFPRLVMHYNITLSLDDVSNINPEQEKTSVYANGGYVYVDTPVAADMRVYSLQGGLMMKKSVGEGRSIIPFDPGIYIVTLNGKGGYKVVVR